MKQLLRDSRVQRLLVANTLGSIGSGITIFAVLYQILDRLLRTGLVMSMVIIDTYGPPSGYALLTGVLLLALLGVLQTREVVRLPATQPTAA